MTQPLDEFIGFIAPGLRVTEKHGSHNQQDHAGGRGGGGDAPKVYRPSGRSKLEGGAAGRKISVTAAEAADIEFGKGQWHMSKDRRIVKGAPPKWKDRKGKVRTKPPTYRQTLDLDQSMRTAGSWFFDADGNMLGKYHTNLNLPLHADDRKPGDIGAA